MIDITFKHERSPGDIVCMTACVRDLATTYPGRYNIYVKTTAKEVWENNPHIAGVGDVGQVIELDYGWGINQATTSPLHFLTIFHLDMSKKIGLPVPVLKPHGDLHISDHEKSNRPIDGRYWCIFAGGKRDYPTKIWSSHYAQQTVHMLKKYGIELVQVGASGANFINPSLKGVLNLTGKTTLRELIWLIYHADGVICPITSGMHIAAALEKPCVVTAGGREHWWWEAYVNVSGDNFGPIASRKIRIPHRFLHTQNMLDCCKGRGCWKNKLKPEGKIRASVCCQHIIENHYGQDLPKCHALVTPQHVVESVSWYYEHNILPPISEPFDGVMYQESLTELVA